MRKQMCVTKKCWKKQTYKPICSTECKQLQKNNWLISLSLLIFGRSYHAYKCYYIFFHIVICLGLLWLFVFLFWNLKSLLHFYLSFISRKESWSSNTFIMFSNNGFHWQNNHNAKKIYIYICIYIYSNLQSSLLRCGTRLNERGTQWDLNSLV